MFSFTVLDCDQYNQLEAGFYKPQKAKVLYALSLFMQILEVTPSFGINL